MRTIKTFRRGSSTFNCRVCTRLTRHVEADQSGCGDICHECFELAGMENAISDYGDEAVTDYKNEIIDHLKVLKTKKGADMSTWTDLMTRIGVTLDNL
jgi:hypothetical protein